MAPYDNQASSRAHAPDEAYRLLRPSVAPVTVPENPNTIAVAVGMALVWIPTMVLLIGSLCTYGIRDGLVTTMVCGLFVSLTAQLGRIPLAGPVIYSLVMRHFVHPMVFGWFPTIHPSWITEGQYWLGLATAIVLTIATIFTLLAKRRD